MDIRRLESKDVTAAWQINEQGLPGTGQVSLEEMADLFSLVILPVGLLTGKENTTVSLGLLTSGSHTHFKSCINTVNGSLLSIRTRLM